MCTHPQMKFRLSCLEGCQAQLRVVSQECSLQGTEQLKGIENPQRRNKISQSLIFKYKGSIRAREGLTFNWAARQGIFASHRRGLEHIRTRKSINPP